MNFLAALASILPQIMQAITVAETIFPTAGAGESKLAHVVTRAKEIISGAPLLVEHATQLMGAVEPAVKGIVSILNATGIFQHGGYVEPAAPAAIVADNAKLADELEAELNAQGGAQVNIPASLVRDTINALRAASPGSAPVTVSPPGGAQDASGRPATSAPGG
jgi:hypothetical protein